MEPGGTVHLVAFPSLYNMTPTFAPIVVTLYTTTKRALRLLIGNYTHTPVQKCRGICYPQHVPDFQAFTNTMSIVICFFS